MQTKSIPEAPDASCLTNLFLAEQDFTVLRPISSKEASVILLSNPNQQPIVHVPFAILMKHFDYDDDSGRLWIKQTRSTP